MGVLCSRFLGFVRDMVMAHFMGTGLAAEAFFVAQRIPNVMRDLVGEGAANAAIVPVLSEYQQQRSRPEWQALINVIMAWGLLVLGGITVVGLLAAPWIVQVMAPGFREDPQKFQLTVELTRIMFPYLILIALAAFQSGILFSINSFVAPAFGPCLLNVVMIGSGFAAVWFGWPFVYVLSLAVVLGGMAQFWVQWLALRAKGVQVTWPRTFQNEGARKVLSLLIPRIWGSGVYQINVLADTLCASLAFIVGPGGVAALYYATRIIQFPLGVFGYALSSVSLPVLSKIAADGDMRAFKQTLLFSLRNLLLVLVPCAALLAVGAPWIIRVVFERGAFGAYSTEITAQALFFSSLGLPFYGASRLLAGAFYALQDSKTPAKSATICLIVNIVLNVLLMFPLKIGGIALASSIASLVNTLMLWTSLKKKLNRSQ